MIWTDDDNALGRYLTPGAAPTAYTIASLTTRLLKQEGLAVTEAFDRMTDA